MCSDVGEHTRLGVSHAILEIQRLEESEQTLFPRGWNRREFTVWISQKSGLNFGYQRPRRGQNARPTWAGVRDIHPRPRLGAVCCHTAVNPFLCHVWVWMWWHEHTAAPPGNAGDVCLHRTTRVCGEESTGLEDSERWRHSSRLSSPTMGRTEPEIIGPEYPRREAHSVGSWEMS